MLSGLLASVAVRFLKIRWYFRTFSSKQSFGLHNVPVSQNYKPRSLTESRVPLLWVFLVLYINRTGLHNLCTLALSDQQKNKTFVRRTLTNIRSGLNNSLHNLLTYNEFTTTVYIISIDNNKRAKESKTILLFT